jgi:hypothetical protein
VSNIVQVSAVARDKPDVTGVDLIFVLLGNNNVEIAIIRAAKPRVGCIVITLFSPFGRAETHICSLAPAGIGGVHRFGFLGFVFQGKDQAVPHVVGIVLSVFGKI